MKKLFFLAVLFVFSCQLIGIASAATFSGELTESSDSWIFRYDNYYYDSEDFTVPEDGSYRVEVIYAEFDSILLLMEGIKGSEPEMKIGEDDDSGVDFLSRIDIELDSSKAYFFNIETYDPNTTGEWMVEIAPVHTPLPAAVWLLGSGFVGLVGARRKLKK